MHGQPTSSSDSRQNFVSLFEEAYGFSGEEQLYATTSRASHERKSHDQREIESQTGSRRSNEDIEVRTDVTVQSKQH